MLLTLLGLIVGELRLYGFHKIPFTCSYQPGKAHWHMAFLAFGVLMFLTVLGAGIEEDALRRPLVYAALAAGLISAAILTRFRTQASTRTELAVLEFDDPPEPVIQPLGLHRDGTLPIEG